MEFNRDDIRARVNMLKEFISCAYHIHFTEYDSHFNRIQGDDDTVDVFFWLDYDGSDVLETWLFEGKPIIHVNSVGMCWVADVEMEDTNLCGIHVMGPVFLDDFSQKKLEQKLDRIDISLPVKKRVREVIKRIPVMSIMKLREYGSMLHYLGNCETSTKS